MSTSDPTDGTVPAESQAPRALDHNHHQYRGLQPGSYTDQKLVCGELT